MMKFYGDNYGPENQKFAILADRCTIKTTAQNPSTHEIDNVTISGWNVRVAKGHAWDRTNGPKIIWEKKCKSDERALAATVEEAEAEVKRLQEDAIPKTDKAQEYLKGQGFE